mmetsp:Transcript_12865/g.36165  ORF Transcript_12865/g.36165 Transcript_12865/m.36165 type:complete len:106 (+) Transcript_12865:105-422(+)
MGWKESRAQGAKEAAALLRQAEQRSRSARPRETKRVPINGCISQPSQTTPWWTAIWSPHGGGSRVPVSGALSALQPSDDPPCEEHRGPSGQQFCRDSAHPCLSGG